MYFFHDFEFFLLQDILMTFIKISKCRQFFMNVGSANPQIKKRCQNQKPPVRQSLANKMNLIEQCLKRKRDTLHREQKMILHKEVGAVKLAGILRTNKK